MRKVKFWRKRPPGGGAVSEEYAAGMRTMEEWYQGFVVWAYAYISLLERRLRQREKEGGGESQEGNDEGRNANRQEDA